MASPEGQARLGTGADRSPAPARRDSITCDVIAELLAQLDLTGVVGADVVLVALLGDPASPGGAAQAVAKRYRRASATTTAAIPKPLQHQKLQDLLDHISLPVVSRRHGAVPGRVWRYPTGKPGSA